MAIEIRVPTLGESVSEATIGKWLVKVGESVKADQPLLELETDKVALEVVAPSAGSVTEYVAQEGDTVTPNALLAMFTAGAFVASAPVAAAAPVAVALANNGPAVAKAAAESGINLANVAGSGKDGRVTKGDLIAPVAAPVVAAPPREIGVREERVKMTKLRQVIARRLKEAQNTAAMLTTFNEVDMTAVMALRTQYKDLFEKKHGVKLGFMGFFVKACTQALKEIPAINAEIDGGDVIYKNFAHIAVAVGTDKGLVVPVVKDADAMSIAQVEKEIGNLGRKARDGQLTMADMTGGTFTISNGGVYGSLMSTPILNAPQSGILGMHKIQDRPVVVNGKIEIRPMMYLALSYDHRIVDGKEAVTFLVRVKEGLEDPARLVMDL
jgi:2-oxoglutarate dehydrogenase E2 component (dihydrolipoamide succinyltransferase)